ncbi:hypothetical protein AB0H76_17680 [Nocardia sp. NPDC050712]|uniref:hypothetical protein n=1 Tax=Nocardia sp. NPDC050712 TaxID=3155518 RepID=UPI0033CBBE51
MTLRERSEQKTLDTALVYGEPSQTPEGSTIITVSAFSDTAARPVGIFVVHGGQVTWKAAEDRIGLIQARTGLIAATVGTVTGLLAAAFVTGALLRRPPWPDIRTTLLSGSPVKPW